MFFSKIINQRKAIWGLEISFLFFCIKRYFDYKMENLALKKEKNAKIR
uniref:Uncharacterized protein n=1 Tax=Myoviridae sp. ctBtT5 TaxID=2825048 RepID=A0A8S5Q0B3_9CAUD|nr:MAG TPA: hypothetical protein [Myoviridae sp. ctBtT5]